MKDKMLIIFSLLGVFILCFFVIYTDKRNNIKMEDIKYSIDIDNGDYDINWNELPHKKIELDGNLEINRGGVYELSGTILDGYIYINTSSNVKLILNNVYIKNLKGAAVIVDSVDTLVVELADDSYNKLRDGKVNDSEYDACFYSKDDVVFRGNGVLDINANFKDAIVSKDDLKFISGTYKIKSVGDGIKGKDSVTIINGDFLIDALDDGIKSYNENHEDKGFINIENGTFNIKAGSDGIQAISNIIIHKGNFIINSSKESNSNKALKVEDKLLIFGGKFNCNTIDDTFHSNNIIGIKNSHLNLISGNTCLKSENKIILEDSVIKYDNCDKNIVSKKIISN